MSKKRKGGGGKKPSGSTGPARPSASAPPDAPPRRSWLATHGRDLRFILIFAFVMAVYWVATSTDFASQKFFPWYLDLNASYSAVMLNAIGYDDVTAPGNMLGDDAFRIRIERGCDAVDPSALFVAAVLASPVVFWRKLPAVAGGVLVLLALNLVRIVTLYLTGRHFKSVFDIMHLDVWQAMFIGMALMLWAVWARYLAHPRRHKTHVANA